MPTNTYSDRVNIIKYIKLDEGWRFAPLARKPNGNIRWDTVLVEGVEMRHPEGRYFIEWRHEGRRRRKAVGTIPSEILAAAQRQRAILNLRSTGVEVKEPEPSARMTYLQDASAKYLRDVQMNKARSTYVHYRQTLNLFKASLEKATIQSVDRDDLMDFQAYLYKLGMCARTVKNKTIIVVQFLKKFGVSGLLADDDWPTYTEPERETYKAEEMQRFFNACEPQEYVLFQFFLHTGFRDQEVRHAFFDDVDLEAGIVRVTPKPHYKFSPKGKQCREVPIPDALVELLRARRKRSSSELIFPSRPHSKAPLIRRGGKPSDEFLEDCKAVAERAELNCGRCVDKQGRSCADGPYCERFYLHKFRHTFATMHLQSGVDIRTVAAWLGHKNVKTTMIYLKDARGSDIRRKVNGGLLATAFSLSISTEPRRGQLVAMAR